MSISITTSATAVRVVSPYNPDFVRGAKALGGKWSAPAWQFDVRDEARVRALCIEHYGTDGSPAAGPAVTLRLVFEAGYAKGQDAIRIGGREVAKAFGRDSGAKLGDGVVLLEGKFNSGGSMKNWTTTAGRDGATVLLRDVPKAMADRLLADAPSGVTVTVEPEAPVINRAALATERERLVARLAEIDGLLA